MSPLYGASAETISGGGYRVLVGPQGSRLRQIASADAPAQRIALAIR